MSQWRPLLSCTCKVNIRGGADKSLARPTSQCRTVSLERGVCSRAELQAFSCYKGWKACQATRAISTTSSRELPSCFFPPARQGAEGNSRHSDRNIRTCAIVCHRQNWVAQFKRGDFSTCDAPRPGRPETYICTDVSDQTVSSAIDKDLLWWWKPPNNLRCRVPRCTQ